jgi:hypothetical protein
LYSLPGNLFIAEILGLFVNSSTQNSSIAPLQRGNGLRRSKSDFLRLLLDCLGAAWKNPTLGSFSTLTPQKLRDYHPSRVRNNLGTTN